jgi:hypothetical protein
MEMKKFLLALMYLSLSAFAHDEGHGPKLTDTPKQGGVVSPVVKASEAKMGSKAVVVHKAELVRSDDGAVSLYLYDASMKPLALTAFQKEAKAELAFKKKKKWTSFPFVLKLETDAFKGQAPKAGAKPFNIDVHLNDGKEELLVAFDNLD